MDIWSILEHAARVHPDREAVVDGARRFTYAQLCERARRLAAFFAARGIVAGDRVSIVCLNSHEFVEAYFAAARAGVLLNPLNVRLAPREMAGILADCEPRWLIADARIEGTIDALVEFDTSLAGVLWARDDADGPMRRDRTIAAGLAAEEYEAALASARPTTPPAPVKPDDTAHLYYTSGTTGVPKGVALTHRNVCVHARAAILELDLAATDTWAHIAPMFHLADAWATFAITWCGGRHVMSPRFEVETALDRIAAERVTITNLIPTMLSRMVRHPLASQIDASSLRLLLSGGAPIAPAIVREVIETFGCEYVQTYGMTETSPYLTLSRPQGPLASLSPEEQFPYRCKTGRAFSTIELRVVDDSGRDVACDETSVGEIWVRGETVTPGYWNRPEETAAAFHDGWLKTGDLAVIDHLGYVTIVDRKKDMILSGGENVYSTEVEAVLHAHPDVLEAAVFGVPDAEWGESVRAAVVLRARRSEDPDGIREFCRTQLAAYKVPRQIHFRADLPRTGSGKIQKRELRAIYIRAADP